MPHVPGLRSEYSLTGRLVHFGRMLDKIRLHSEDRLPADYHANLGIGFDGRTCNFLGIDYPALKTRVLAGGCDEDILQWAHAKGGARTDEQCMVWNRFMMKLGWRDDRTPALLDRIASSGLTGKRIETMFDFNDFDEGRDPVAARSWELNEPRVLLLMGVSGSGKTTVGRLLAASLGWTFTDADDFHPPANVAKLSAAIPLTDDDRAPWLANVRRHIDTRLAARENTVLACSALKSSYRDLLLNDPGCVKLIHLKGSPELLATRLAGRSGHFAPPALLASQLSALEEPRYALTLDIAPDPDVLVASIRRHYPL
jgi:carbohydrate kinase (thermoresistant glucokinase family)